LIKCYGVARKKGNWVKRTKVQRAIMMIWFMVGSELACMYTYINSSLEEELDDG